MKYDAIDLRLTQNLPFYAQCPLMITCKEPTHRDSERSMAIYRNYVKCFGCQKLINRKMEALAYLLYGDTTRWREAIGEAGKYTRSRESEVGWPNAPQLKTLPTALATLYHNNLNTSRSARKEWLFGRGLTQETIDKFHLGHDGSRFCLPIFGGVYYNSNRCTDNLTTIRFRRDDYYDTDGPKYSGLRGRNQALLYPEWLLEPSLTELIIWEGELDVCLSWQHAKPAVTITNGAGRCALIPSMLREKYPHINTLQVGCDMDDAGTKARAETISEARRLGFVVRSISWDISEGKDLTEYLRLIKR